MSNTNTGKIARADYKVRTRVNEMLRDGATAKAVIKFLESKDIFGVNDQNVTNWREGGYQAWLNEQKRTAELQADRDFAMDIVRENDGNKLGEAAQVLAASQLFNTLRDFDVSVLRDLLKEKPENYAAIVNALAKIGKTTLDLEKYKDLVAEKILDKAILAKADEINNSTMNNAEKIAAMRKALFKSVDELQASGRIKIPKA